MLLMLTNSCKKTEIVTDIDGNVYHTINIGNATWMVENLKVTHYRNGDSIPNVTDNVELLKQQAGIYCNYNNNTNNAVIYGRLYNYYALIDKRGLCPVGWHIPTGPNWKVTENYLRGQESGGEMKEIGTTHWVAPNTNATNSSGFSALPGGYREENGRYKNIGYEADFWSITSGSYWQDMPGCYSLHWDGGLSFYREKVSIFECYSVRCVKDNDVLKPGSNNNLKSVMVNLGKKLSADDIVKIHIFIYILLLLNIIGAIFFRKSESKVIGALQLTSGIILFIAGNKFFSLMPYFLLHPLGIIVGIFMGYLIVRGIYIIWILK